MTVEPIIAPAPSALRVPELLAPAGGWECARAAVENGADAIYFGLDRFNARMRADNFTEADLPALMEYLHRRGVRGYVTFNTLVFTDELPQAEAYLRAIIAAGVDAAIVQDLGVCHLIRQLSPDFPIHASTQMTVTSAAGVEFVRSLGCSLAVLARECSIPEIAAIHGASELPLEVFVHGALCVAYSGQCLTSEALGGRSANRGECAQACRMPYDLLVDGEPAPLGDRRYLLSPQDLSGLEVVPDLARAGVTSLKIEGRLKTPEYVAAITRVYRAALDRLESPPDPEARYELEMSFSRGLHTGWLRGIDNQRLVHARFGKKRGVYLGDVERVRGREVLLRPQAPLKAGDGVVFDAGRPDEAEIGGRVQEVNPAGNLVSVTFAPNPHSGGVDLARVSPGDKLWKTSDPALERKLRQTFAGDAPRFQRPVEFTVQGAVGTPLLLTVHDDRGNTVRVESALPLAAAEREPLSAERLTAQLGRLGGTPYRLARLTHSLVGDVILPVSELNRMRRAAVAQLDALRSRPRHWRLRDTAPSRPAPGATLGTPRLIVLVRSLPQLEAALGAELVYCDFEDPKAYRLAVPRIRAAGGSAWVAPPRVFKAGEEWILNQVRSAGADGYLVRNYDHLRYFDGERCVADFSFNIANPLAAEALKSRARLERLTASYDLNAAQLESLLRAAPPGWFEVTIHQHMPMFHMEHCLFCAFLSKGKDYRDCGRPCDKHEVRLRDRVGQEHPLKADSGCRNTVYNARAQTGADSVERLLALGLRHLRVEFVNESAEEAARALSRYRALLRGEITGAELWRELRLQNQLGVTRGQMQGVLIAFHKPYGVLSQFTAEPGSAWGTLAGFGLPAGVYPLGRLDADSEGLLLLSDEPGLNERLLHPRHAHARVYWAQVERAEPADEALARLAAGGLVIGEHATLPCRAVRLAAPDVPPREPPVRYRKNVPDAWIALELTEGKNRQVRRMTAAVGHPTLRLIRVQIGGLMLGQLASGEWKILTDGERRLAMR